MSIVEKFVMKYGRVYHDGSYANPLVGTTYCTVGLGDDLGCYSVVGEHSWCSRDWLDAQEPVPYCDLSDFEKATLTREVMATINPEYPVEVPYNILVNNWLRSQVSGQNLLLRGGTYLKCYRCDGEANPKYRLYWETEGDVCSAVYCKGCYDLTVEQCSGVVKTVEDLL